MDSKDNANPELSIIIVNFNTNDLLAQCLKSIYSTIEKHEFEVIVVDNNSLDGSVKMVKRKYSKVHLIENKENVGFAKANNQGIRVGTGNYFLLLNPDTIISQESIDKMVDLMKRNHEIGVMGPKVLNSDITTQWTSCGTLPTLLRVFLWQIGFSINRKWCTSNPWYLTLNKSDEVDWISGVCMLIRKKVFKQIGFIDESFFSYFEDVDFCYRARKRGWTVYYFNDAKITHLLSQSWKSMESVKVKLESEIMFFRKYYGSISAFLAVLFTIYGSLLRLFVWKLFINGKSASTKICEHKTILKWCFSKI